MSREYKARDKKHQKMSRDGLVERNAATGEEVRVSGRDEDFSLRQGQPYEKPVTPQARDAPKQSIKPKPQRYGQTADIRQDTSGQGQTGIQNQYTPVTQPDEPAPETTEQEPSYTDKPMEAAKPTERSHEARSHESPAGPSPWRRGGKTTKKPTPPPTATENSAEQPGRLQFDKTPVQSAPDTKPRQSGTKYSQRFTQDAAKPDKPPDTQGETPTTERPGRLQFENVTEQAAPDAKQQQSGVKPGQQFHPDAAVPDGQSPPNGTKPDIKPPAPDAERPSKLGDKPSKLQFSKDEKPPADNGVKPEKKLSQLQQKAEKADNRLGKARDRLPGKRHAKTERTFDEKKGKVKHKIQFEKEVLPPGTRPFAPAPVELAKRGTGNVTRMGANKLHQKVYEVEHENVGIKAGHRTEQALESVYDGGKRITRSAFQFVRNRPYRTVAKLEKRAAKANVKFAYRTALNENPQLKSNLFSRYMQKRKIKQQYAKAAREAKKAGQAVQKTGNIAAKAAKALAGVIKRHPVAVSIIVLLLLVVFMFSALFTSCSSMAGGGFSGIIASSYLAAEPEIDNAELNYTEWETDLLMQIGRTESDYPGYDEYRYQVDNIGHNPYELIAFLTAMYGDFQYADVQAVLQEIFNAQYSLSTVASVETRYADPSDANDDGDYEPYDWHVLTVKFTSRSFTDVVFTRMDAEQREIYSLLMQTKGNRQYIESPFDFNWLPYVTSYYGYRIHPTSGAKDYHKGVDIGIPTGTDIHAGQDGTVTYAGYNGDYGYVVVLDDGKGLVSKYAHCDTLLVSAGQTVKTGDVIAKSGNTGNSTGPHLHLEVIKDGQYLNPLYFAVTNDNGNGPVYGDPGAPMGDGSYAALIAEAERYLGYPYVWGGSSPSTSFDCSGYVSWVLTQSGVKNTGRLGAQDLYNICTPVSPADAQPGDLIFFTGYV